MRPWLAIIGVGDDGLSGLSPSARTLIDTAELLVGGMRHLTMIAEDDRAERLCWDRPLESTITKIAAWRGRRVVVLASGDPLWFGVGVVLARHFSAAEMIILPHAGAFSLAAARLGWPLAECATISLHARPHDTLRLHLAPGCRVLALSEDGGTPSAVAELLTGLGWGPSLMTVLSHLGGPNEAIKSGEARCWGTRRVPDLNIVALECRIEPGGRALSRLAGLPDEAFEHDGQLTKREVRAATLAALAPLAGERLWDVGAGCGSVAIEWLRSGDRMAAAAVERDPQRAAIIARNAASLGVPGLHIAFGTAPEALAGLAPPDAIFVGGGLGTPGLLPAVWMALRPGGRLVANAVTVAGEARLFEWHAQHGGSLTRVAVSRAEPAGAHHLWRPLAGVTQWTVVKPG